MSKVCKFTIPASRDIEGIIDYIADVQSLDAADRLLDTINKKCRNLAIFPSLGRCREELAPNLRSFPVEEYLIFYRLVEDGVEILRVVSGYRDLEAFSLKDKGTLCSSQFSSRRERSPYPRFGRIGAIAGQPLRLY
jgi:toxin ParE1/3/4